MNQNVGHYADRELAYAYLKVDRFDKALEHALMEYNRRPDNIDVNETVAWVYYCKNQFAEALPYLQTALKTDSKNPLLLYRASLIYAKAGKRSEARAILKKAMTTDYSKAKLLKKEEVDMLKSLQ